MEGDLTARFHEVQRARTTPLSWLVPIAWVAAMVMTGISLPSMLEGPGQWAALSISGFVVLMLGLVTGLLMVAKLVTQVRDDGVWVRWFPLTRQHVYRYQDIERCYARSYRPIREYGGWGVRGVWGGNHALSMRGRDGVQLVFRDGRRLLIGSDRAAELSVAIIRTAAAAGVTIERRTAT